MKKQFTWTEIYTELAQKLIDYKNNRAKLIEILNNVFESYRSISFSAVMAFVSGALKWKYALLANIVFSLTKALTTRDIPERSFMCNSFILE